MTVNVNLTVGCGFAGCPWSMAVDPESGADAMAVHAAFLEHLDVHDPDGAEAEAPVQWVGVAQTLVECSSCHAAPGQPHTDYCTLPKWAEHDAEVARALAEDRIPASFTCPQCKAVSYHPEDVRQGYCGRCHTFAGAHPTGGFYAGQLYAGDTPEQIAAEQARIDRFMAGGNDA
ncbi:MAG TPA: hypothetical protein VIQ30_12745 [Pseudonocardia sp.]